MKLNNYNNNHSNGNYIMYRVSSMCQVLSKIIHKEFLISSSKQLSEFSSQRKAWKHKAVTWSHSLSKEWVLQAQFYCCFHCRAWEHRPTQERIQRRKISFGNQKKAKVHFWCDWKAATHRIATSQKAFYEKEPMLLQASLAEAWEEEKGPVCKDWVGSVMMVYELVYSLPC